VGEKKLPPCRYWGKEKKKTGMSSSVQLRAIGSSMAQFRGKGRGPGPKKKRKAKATKPPAYKN